MSISGCRLWYFVSPKIHSGPIHCNLKIARTAILGLTIARVNGVKMLCNGGPALDDLEVQLLEVLVHQRHRDVLCAHVRRVPRAWHFPDRQSPPCLLLLHPEHVHFDMS